MNAVVAVGHCPPLPADTPLDEVCSTSKILNAGSVLFLTKRVGMAHAEQDLSGRLRRGMRLRNCRKVASAHGGTTRSTNAV